MKRILPLFLLLCLFFTVLPVSAYAAGTDAAISLPAGNESDPAGDVPAEDGCAAQPEGITLTDISEDVLVEVTGEVPENIPVAATSDDTPAERIGDAAQDTGEDTEPAADESIYGGIRILQTDEAGTPLTGSVFGIYNASTDEKIAEITTGSDGTAAWEQLETGCYYLKELAAPSGFAPQEGIIPFAIETQGEVILKTVVSSAGRGTLKITVSGENGEALSGAAFAVYREPDNIQISEITTDSGGMAEIELPLGRYYLLETGTAAGYRLPEDAFPFTLTEQGATVGLSIQNRREPEPENGAVRLLKVAEGTDAPLSGAVFGVYEANSNEKLAEIITGAGGTAEMPLPAGGYYLIEQTAPEGFVRDESRIDFTVASGEITALTVTNTPIPPAEPDPPATGQIRLTKKAEGTDALLSGAVFGIYEAGSDIKVAELTTGSDGTALSDALPAGSYYLLERTAPSGYKLNTDKNGVTVIAGETAEITVYNAAQDSDSGDDETGRLCLIKKAEDSGEKLSGAVFGIYSADNDKKVAEITTGNDGTATYELAAGRYYLLELTAPSGYTLKTDKISFTVKTGETVDVTAYNTPKGANASDTGKLYLVKKAESTGAKLPGAVFGIYSADNDKKVAEITTDSDGTAVYELTPGDYYLRELQAPTGYLLEPASIPFTIKADETVHVEVTNMRDESAAAASDIAVPKTGEPFPYGSYALSALFMAVALLCGVLLYRERERRHRTA